MKHEADFLVSHSATAAEPQKIANEKNTTNNFPQQNINQESIIN